MGQSASSPSSSPSAPRSPSYAYSRLPARDPDDDDGDDPETAITLARSPSKRRSRSCRHHCCRAKTFELTVMILSFTAAAALLGFANFVRIARDDSTRTVPGINDVSVREASRWAQYAPFVPAAAYTPPREGCRVVQVNLLQRHGARWPTSGARLGQVVAVSKLQAVVRDFTDPRLDFLRGFKYDWGSDDLLPYGALQSQEAGEVMFERYAATALIGEGNLPFVRAADKARVVDSATNWTAGVFAASGGAVDPILNVEISESGNITLDDSMCPNAVSGDESAEWLAAFAPPIVARLNAWAPGANLTEEDALSLMDMCPFHTAVEQERSPFCELFEAGEFEAYEYFYDLDKFYGTGYGNALGPVQGVGYVNELIARLTGEAVRDNTQTNRTLDADPETFPLDRTFYADFSHDNEMVAIYSAMGLFRQRAMLSTTKVDQRRTWINSRLVPFSSRMVVEKVECGGAGEEFVRVMVGDEVQPLEFCGADGEGMCALDAFVDSQRYAREDGQGDFEKCGFVSS